MDWQNWCSFCANMETEKFRLDAVTNFPLEIHEQFHIFHQNEQVRICLECSAFLMNLVQFEEKCRKVQSMFEIIAFASSDDLADRNFLHKVRADIGLDNQMVVVKEEIDISAEPLELDFIPVKCDPFEPLDVFTSFITPETDNNSYDVTNDEILDDDNQFDLSNDAEQYEENVSLPPNRKLRNRLVPKLQLDDIMNAKREMKEMHPPSAKKRRQQSLLSESQSNVSEKIQANGEDSHEIRFWKCVICDLDLGKNQQKYERHMAIKHPNDESIYKCSACSKGFSKITLCKRHERTHLPDDQRLIHPCPYCDRRFSQKPNMLSHVGSVHVKDKKWICDKCGKGFINKGGLQSHQLTHVDEKPHQCSYCPSHFKSKAALRRHSDIHVSVNICSVCGLKLKSRETLRSHMAVHSDKMPFKCKYPSCGAAFKHSKSLKVHLILHSGLKPYKCWFQNCQYASNNKSNFNLHRRRHHAVEWAEWKASGKEVPRMIIPRLDDLQYRF